MKIKHQLMIAVCAITAIALQSCKKDRTIIEINNNTIKKGSSFNATKTFSKSAPVEQKFTINSEIVSYVVGNRGTKIIIPENALLHQNGSPVTGNVEITLIEYQNKADMLFSNVTVTSGTDILESGGMYFISAKQNGEELKARPEKIFQIEVPKSDPNQRDMNFWEGNLKSNDSLNKIDWVKRDSVVVQPIKDTSNSRYYIQFNYFKFGYHNIDCKIFNNLITKFKIKLPSHCKDTNSSALLLFKDYNACAWCNWGNDELLTTYYRLGLNEQIKVLVYKKTGPGADDYAYAIKNITLIDDTFVDFSNDNLTPCTYNELESVIEAL